MDKENDLSADIATAELSSPSASGLGQAIRYLLLGLTALLPLWFLLFTAPGDVLATNKQVLIYGVVLTTLVCIWKMYLKKRNLAKIQLPRIPR